VEFLRDATSKVRSRGKSGFSAEAGALLIATVTLSWPAQPEHPPRHHTRSVTLELSVFLCPDHARGASDHSTGIINNTIL
jgi:hypothetical protein